jgi:prepilin-type processing-associated H-X9-DG protein
VCQAHLRQWGSLWATIVAENDGHFPRWDPHHPDGGSPVWDSRWGWGWGPGLGLYWDQHWVAIRGIRCCPMAARPASPTGLEDGVGGTFLAWGRCGTREDWQENRFPGSWEHYYGSYGASPNILAPLTYPVPQERPADPTLRRIHEIKGQSNIPVYLDCTLPDTAWWRNDIAPPQSDAIPTDDRPAQHGRSCINRHNGGVNGLFLDWSVRKVGLKELWTLKWHKAFDTAGPWTKAGGVRPEDWPQWMRRFRDY